MHFACLFPGQAVPRESCYTAGSVFINQLRPELRITFFSVVLLIVIIFPCLAQAAARGGKSPEKGFSQQVVGIHKHSAIITFLP